jgi:sensor domain CHASE-containing protein
MGGPELVVVLAIAMPVVIALWFARFMHRIHEEQRAIRERLEVIERSLPRESPK